MPDAASRTAPPPTIAFRDVLSDDGTRLRAWTNDPERRVAGPTVVLCNGLGTNPFAWPALLDPACGVRVVSWDHRGTGGSERPRDRDAVEVDDFVRDALSVMDAFGIDRAVMLGWSMGVNTMFQLAVDHPERVTGLFAVAGVPGDTFATMLGPLRLPRLAAKALTVGFARTLKHTGQLLTPVASRLPIGERAIAVLSHSGFMLPVADPQLTAQAVSAFLQTPMDWYFHMALSTSRHRRVSLSAVRVPCVFVAGRWDVMAGARAMASAADRVADGTYVELNGTHFVQMEHPDEIHRLLLDLLARVPDEQAA